MSGLTGDDVNHDSLTGSDVNESTLVLPALAAVAEGPISSGTLTGAVDIAATLTFTVPANGYVRVTGSASMSAYASRNSWIIASLHQDGTQIQGQYWDAGDADGFYDLRQSIDGVSAVTAGTHTWTLRLRDSLATDFSRWALGQVTVEFFPAGSAPYRPTSSAANKQPE